MIALLMLLVLFRTIDRVVYLPVIYRNRYGCTPEQGSYIQCTAPPQSAWNASASINYTVSLRLFLQTPIFNATLMPSGRGIGNAASSILDVEHAVITPLAVSSVYAVGLLNRSGLTMDTHTLRRASTVPTGLGSSSWRSTVYGDSFMFTYTSGGAACGCDVDANSKCDVCGESYDWWHRTLRSLWIDV
jgi:hypothetical protein